MVKMRMDDFGIWVHAHAPGKYKKMRKMRPQEVAARERRAVVRRAYFLIRDDPCHRDITLTFARALGGKIDLTDDLLHQATQIVFEHADTTLQ